MVCEGRSAHEAVEGVHSLVVYKQGIPKITRSSVLFEHLQATKSPLFTFGLRSSSKSAFLKEKVTLRLTKDFLQHLRSPETTSWFRSKMQFTTSRPRRESLRGAESTRRIEIKMKPQPESSQDTKRNFRRKVRISRVVVGLLACRTSSSLSANSFSNPALAC